MLLRANRGSYASDHWYGIHLLWREEPAHACRDSWKRIRYVTRSPECIVIGTRADTYAMDASAAGGFLPTGIAMAASIDDLLPRVSRRGRRSEVIAHLR